MTEETRYFLVPVSSGLCIQPGLNKTVTSPVQGSAGQLWFIEHEQDDSIAFRNAQSGDYLRAIGAYSGQAVQQGARQLWTLETSDTPHAFWIKCDDYPDAYLCNAGGSVNPNNPIYVWAKQAVYTQHMLWYFFDYEYWLKHHSSRPDMQAFNATPLRNGGGISESKLREAEEKQRELEDKLKVAEDKQRNLESKDEDFAARLKQFDKRERELMAKQQELDSKEKASLEREKEIEDRERKAEEREAAPPKTDSTGSQELENLRNQLRTLQDDQRKKNAAQNELAVKNAELVKLRKAYDELERRQRSTNSSDSGFGLGAGQVGLRDKPLRMRTMQQRASTRRGRLPPITMPTEFTSLPRLRAN